MKITLLHLSDIHFTVDAAANVVLGRAVAVSRAVTAMPVETRGCVVAISGDIAFSGKASEYAHARSFLEALRSELEKIWSPAAVRMVCVPGNHDVDFPADDQARELLIAALTQGLNANGEVQESVVALCTEGQSSYRAFASNTMAADDDARCSQSSQSLYSCQILEIEGCRLAMHLFNSAWISRRKERQGSLLLPIGNVKALMATPPQAAISISMMHHPFNWFEANNARQVRKVVEEVSDIILTGHEHEPGSYSKLASAGEQNEYLEGGVLQDNNAPATSGFNVVTIDIEGGRQQTQLFEWYQDHYRAVGEAPWRPFQRNKGRLRTEFEFSDEFTRHLSDPGAHFLHPQQDPLLLKHIYVYPDFSELDWKKPLQRVSLVRGREIVSHILANRYVLIGGQDKGGKTALAKVLTEDLRKSGKVPLLVRGADLTSQDETKLRRTLDTALGAQYSAQHRDRYWLLDQANRAIVIDDYHQSPLGPKHRDQVLRLLFARFDVVVLTAATGLILEEFTGLEATERNLWRFMVLEIMEFGLVLRNAIITRWCTLGRDHDADDRRMKERVLAIEELVTMALGRDLLPALPIFILVLLQTLEAKTRLATTNGSFGYLYQALITAGMARSVLDDIDIETKFNYLAEFAFALFKLGVPSMSNEDARNWHGRHCAAYRLSLPYEALKEDFLSTGVLGVRSDGLGFKYKYGYWFFVARYLSDHIDDAPVKSDVTRLSSRLHHEDSANIFLFLCYMNRGPFVLGALLARANLLFANYPQCELGTDVTFFNRLQVDSASELPKLEIPDSDPDLNRQRLREEHDQARLDDSAVAVKVDVEASDEVQNAELNEALQLNSAFKTIQILGQALRNFSGSLKGDQKREMTVACYSLGLRTLTFMFRTFEAHGQTVLASITDYMRSQHAGKLPSEIVGYVNRFVFGLVSTLVFTMVKHVTGSVGMEALAETYLEALGENPSTAQRLIDLSIRLDHFEGFPLKKVEALHKETRKNIFAHTVLRTLVWQHIYLYHVDFKAKQTVLKMLDIEPVRPAYLLDARAKS